MENVVRYKSPQNLQKKTLGHRTADREMTAWNWRACVRAGQLHCRLHSV